MYNIVLGLFESCLTGCKGLAKHNNRIGYPMSKEKMAKNTIGWRKEINNKTWAYNNSGHLRCESRYERGVDNKICYYDSHMGDIG